MITTRTRPSPPRHPRRPALPKPHRNRYAGQGATRASTSSRTGRCIWAVHGSDLWGSYSYIKGSFTDKADGIEWDQTNVATHKLKLDHCFGYRDG